MGRSALKICLTKEAVQNSSTKDENSRPLLGCGTPHNQSLTREASPALSLEDVGRFELKNLLMACDVANSPKTTIFGMSPPVRGGRCGGAANHMTLDRNWQLQTNYGVQHNLQALTERSRHQRSLSASRFLGDPRILVSSAEENSPVGQEEYSPIMVAESPVNCVPFACQTRYFKPQEIK